MADADEHTEPRALVYLEHAIQDGRATADGSRRVVSKRFEFVEVGRDGEVQLAGYAPYLDYRPITSEERELVTPLLAEQWLAEGIESKGMGYAIERAVPAHLEEVRRRTLDRVTRTEVAVKDRLTKEINYWDHRANILKDEELAGKANARMNSAKARQRADDLQARLLKRLQELEQERQLSARPPAVIGGALIVPIGMLQRVQETAPATPPTSSTSSRRGARPARARRSTST